jgi:hypothetical protein
MVVPTAVHGGSAARAGMAIRAAARTRRILRIMSFSFLG